MVQYTIKLYIVVKAKKCVPFLVMNKKQITTHQMLISLYSSRVKVYVFSIRKCLDNICIPGIVACPAGY